MSSPPAAKPETAHDEQLARLISHFTDQLRQGIQPDLESAFREHPELVGELRALWGAVQIAEEFARPQANSEQPTIAKSPDCQPGQEPLSSGPAIVPRAFGDFEILQELGRGGMGVVYKAWQKSLGRTVALKMILRGERATAADLARFKAEATAAGRL